MRILLYKKEPDESREKWKEILESKFKGRRVETFPTADDFTGRLREPSEETKIAILLINDLEDLKHFVSIPHLFLNIPLIIQGPDDSAETIQLAHRLRPRYLSGPEGDFGALLAVLRKILNNPQDFSGGPLKTIISTRNRNPNKNLNSTTGKGKEKRKVRAPGCFSGL